MIYAIILAVLAFGLSVFGFIDRVQIEKEFAQYKEDMFTIAQDAERKLEKLRKDALVEASTLRADFQKRLNALEAKARADVAKAKTAIKKRV